MGMLEFVDRVDIFTQNHESSFPLNAQSLLRDMAAVWCILIVYLCQSHHLDVM